MSAAYKPVELARDESGFLSGVMEARLDTNLQAPASG